MAVGFGWGNYPAPVASNATTGGAKSVGSPAGDFNIASTGTRNANAGGGTSVPFKLNNPILDFGSTSANIGTGGPLQDIVDTSQGLWGGLATMPSFMQSPLTAQTMQNLLGFGSYYDAGNQGNLLAQAGQTPSFTQGQGANTLSGILNTGGYLSQGPQSSAMNRLMNQGTGLGGAFNNAANAGTFYTGSRQGALDQASYSPSFAMGAGRDALGNVIDTGSFFTGEQGRALSDIGGAPSYLQGAGSGLFNNAANAGTFYTGGLQQALDQASYAPSYAMGAGRGTLENITGSGSYFDQGPQSASLDFLTQDSPFAETNPYLQSFMKAQADPLIEQFQEQILPSIGDQASGAGQFGSSRQGIAEGIATRGLADTIGRNNLALASQGYSQGLQSMLAGLGLGQQADEQAFGRQLSGLGLGTQALESQIDRRFQGLGMSQAAREQALGRQLSASQLGQQADEQALNRGLSALGMGQGAQEQALGRQLSGVGLGTQALENQFGRNFQGLGMSQQAREEALQRMLSGAQIGQQAQEQSLGRQLSALGLGSQDQESAFGRQLSGLGLGQAGQESSLQRLMQSLGQAQGADEQAMQRQLQTLGFGSNANIQDRQALMQTLGMAPEVAALGMLPSQILAGIGQDRQNTVQQGIDDLMRRWDYYQNLPANQLDQYASLIQGLNPGNAGTSTTSGANNVLGSTLGGVLGGAQMGSDLSGLFRDMYNGGQQQPIGDINTTQYANFA